MSLPATIRYRTPTMLIALTAWACGGGGASNSGTGPNNPNTPAPTAVLQLAISPRSTTMPQGGSIQIVASAVRVNLASAVTLTVTGAPAGVTSTVSQPQGSAEVVTGTIILTAASTTAPGVYTITITASATGATSQSATFELTVTAVGSYVIALSSSSVSIGPSGSVVLLIGITRNNFAAPITLSLQNAPAGVTAGFTPTPVAGNAASATLNVAPNVALGTYNLTVRGSAAGFADVNVPLTLVVASLGGYTLSATPAAVSLTQGTNRAVTIAIARTQGFAGIVILNVENAPPGLTATLNPSATAASASTLTLTAAANLATGTYNLTIRGMASGLAEQTTVLPVTVTAATSGSGNVTLDFSACVGFDVARWVAYQDGNGAWTPVTGTAGVYRFSITAATGSFVYVTQGPTSQAQIRVTHMTRGEISAAPFVYCVNPVTSLKVVNGSITGMSGGDATNISLGGAFGFANPQLPAFALGPVANGAHDLIAWRHDFIADITGAGNPDRGFIRRDQNIPNGGSAGALDMNGAESFAPASAPFNMQGYASGEEASHTMRYLTGTGCYSALLYTSVRFNGATFTAMGFPSALQRASDFHQVSFTATIRQTGTSTPVAVRTVIETFRAMAPRAMVLPVPIAAPSITTLTGTYKRLQAAFNVPAEYTSAAIFTYQVSSQQKVVAIVATPGYLGGTTATLGMPNFSGLAGWSDAWPPAASATGQWNVSLSGTNLSGGTMCVDNTRIVTNTRQGTY